jgi:hypothetical protein
VPRRKPLNAAARICVIDSALERGHGRLVHASSNRDDVAAKDLMRRIGECRGKFGIRREEQESSRRAVEAADGDELLMVVAEDVEDRRPAFRIASRRDRAARLVQRDGSVLNLRRRGLVDENRRRRRHATINLRHNAAIHTHAAGANQVNGVRP